MKLFSDNRISGLNVENAHFNVSWLFFKRRSLKRDKKERIREVLIKATYEEKIFLREFFFINRHVKRTIRGSVALYIPPPCLHEKEVAFALYKKGILDIREEQFHNGWCWEVILEPETIEAIGSLGHRYYATFYGLLDHLKVDYTLSWRDVAMSSGVFFDLSRSEAELYADAWIRYNEWCENYIVNPLHSARLARRSLFTWDEICRHHTYHVHPSGVLTPAWESFY